MSPETGGTPSALAIRLLPEISARHGGVDEPVLMQAGLRISDCSDAKHKRHSARFTEKKRKQPCNRRLTTFGRLRGYRDQFSTRGCSGMFAYSGTVSMASAPSGTNANAVPARRLEGRNQVDQPSRGRGVVVCSTAARQQGDVAYRRTYMKICRYFWQSVTVSLRRPVSGAPEFSGPPAVTDGEPHAACTYGSPYAVTLVGTYIWQVG